MKLFLIFVWASLVGSGSVGSGPTIHRDQLKYVRGFVRATVDRDGGVLVSTSLEEWTIEDVLPESIRGRIDYRKGDEVELWVGVEGDLGECVEIPNQKIMIVPLTELLAGERTNNVLSFWETRGDSLRLLFLDNMIHVNSLGGIGLGEVIDLGDLGLLVAIESCGYDAQWRWGTYEFSLCSPARENCRLLYSDQFECDLWASQTDSLRYELLERDDRVWVRMIRTNLSFREVKSARRQFDRNVTSIDTSLVELVDLGK